MQSIFYAAFTHAGLTTRCRTKSLYKSILCCQATWYILYEEIRKLA